MIDSDATTIGTKHVLGDGVADAIGILESELTTLGRTVTASAPMLQTITRLGAGLNAFNANAAPIATLSDARYLPDPPMEQLNPAMPKQTLIPSVSRSDDHDRSRSTARFDPATPMHSQAQPRGGESSPPAQQVPRRAPVTTAHKGPIATEPTADRPRVAAIAPATSSPAEPPSSGTVSSEPPSVNQSPVVAISIAPGVPEMVQLRRSEVGATPPAKPPGMTMTDRIAVPPDIRMQRIVIGAMAPNDSPHTANDIPAAQGAPPSDIVGTRILPGTATTPRTTNDLTVQPEGASSASALAEPPRAEAGARQGMIILDGAQLGRWMMDHLERHASRPGAMTTSFDPRMNAAYPGAPTGA